jgi:hypothetical protein
VKMKVYNLKMGMDALQVSFIRQNQGLSGRWCGLRAEAARC